MKIMKTLTVYFILFCFLQLANAQISDALQGKEVFKNDDVVFHQIDDHTWVGTGHMMSNESLYLVEGEKSALLIDAGTNIKDLDKIAASITSKKIMLVATHVHPDHTGSSINCFPELFINPADTVQIRMFMPDYKGRIGYLKDGQIIDLGGRMIEVVFTPAHTPGSTTFIDKKAAYGFSGDSFGSGYLLLSSTFSELLASCEKTSAIMSKYGIAYFYPGHYWGNNPETKQRIDDMITLSRDVLSGKLTGDDNPDRTFGLNRILSGFGMKILYNESAVK
jgi:hydroxyacylglutathione hydrolase